MTSAEDGIAAQIRTIEARYGKPLQEWSGLIAASGLTRHAQVAAMLKADHGMSRGAAHHSGGRLEPSGSFNALFTHRVRVTAAGGLDDEFAGWLAAAYTAAG